MDRHCRGISPKNRCRHRSSSYRPSLGFVVEWPLYERWSGVA